MAENSMKRSHAFQPPNPEGAGTPGSHQNTVPRGCPQPLLQRPLQGNSLGSSPRVIFLGGPLQMLLHSVPGTCRAFTFIYAGSWL